MAEARNNAQFIIDALLVYSRRGDHIPALDTLLGELAAAIAEQDARIAVLEACTVTRRNANL